MAQKSLYIVLTRTTTMPSRIIGRVTGDTYTHAAIALDKELSSIFGFSRKRLHNPFTGGFKRESLNEGIFAICRSLPYAVVELQVTHRQYKKMNSLIKKFVRCADSYRYNYLGLLYGLFGKVYRRNNCFYCSEFVYDALLKCGIVKKQLRSPIRPQDLLSLGQVLREGDWHIDSNSNLVLSE